MKKILALNKSWKAFLLGVGVMVVVFVLMFFIGGVHVATPWIFFLGGQTQIKSQAYDPQIYDPFGFGSDDLFYGDGRDAGGGPNTQPGAGNINGGGEPRGGGKGCPSGGGDGTICCQPIQWPGLPPCENNVCRCLASSAQITSSSGKVSVKDLKEGMLVWTIDGSGNKVLAPIIKLSKVSAPNHKVVDLVLADGRKLQVSAAHPAADGRMVGDLKPDDEYDGSVVASADLIKYEDSHTYDLLPAGDTGYYWANGILIGSTLK